MKVMFPVFLLGLSFGWGPCLASCGPLFLTYIAGTGKNVPRAVAAYLLFSASRIFIYAILGLAVFFLGRLVLAKFAYFFRFSQLAAGIFIILVGILMFLGKDLNLSMCAFLHRYMLEKDKKSIIILGLFVGFLPCAPLLTCLTYAGLAAKTGGENLLYTLAFGLGTALSPLLILAALAGLLPVFMRGSYTAKVFNIICGFIMILLGLRLTWRIF